MGGFMDIGEIRLIRLNELLKNYKTQAEFADAVDTAPSYISQLKAGFKNNGKKVSIGDELARKVEQKLDLERGWMDSLPNNLSNIHKRYVPVKGLAQMGNDGFWTEIDYLGNGGEGYLEISYASDRAYAIRAVGESMFPALRSGWYMAFEPNNELMPGEYVHVILNDGRNMIKEFVSCQNGILTLISVNGMQRISFNEKEVEVINPFIEIQPPSRRILDMPVIDMTNMNCE